MSDTYENFVDKVIVKNIARSLLGFLMVLFGLNGFFQFIPMPPPPEAAMGMLMGLGKTGYFFPMLKVTEITVGLLLLTNNFTPLALTILAPISINIVAFHIFLDPGGIAAALIVCVLNIFLAVCYRDSYKTVLTRKV